MEIQRALQSLASLIGRGAAPAKPVEPIQALQAGQRLEGRVLARIGDRQLLLELAGRQVTADSKVPLPPGARVRLEVVEPGIQPRLRVLDAAPQPQISGLKTFLPRQIPLAEAMRTLAELASNPSPDEALPTPLRKTVTRLLQSLPTLRDLTSADTLARALDRSGLFSEARPSPDSAPDLKQRLLQVAAVLRRLPPETQGSRAETTAAEPSSTGTSGKAKPPTSAPLAQPRPGEAAAALSRSPGTGTPAGQPSPLPDGTPQAPRPDPGGGERLESLLHKVSGAVARIVVDQLNSLPRPEDPTPTWHFEVPFRQGQEFHDLRLTVRGEKAASPGNTGARPWTVDLEMDLPDLGRLQARLIYLNGEITTHLWSDRAATRALFERHLDHLAQRFRQAGLTPRTFRVTEAAIANPRTVHDGPLIDERI